MTSNSTFVLDAFALIGFFRGEPAVIRVREMFQQAYRGEISLVAGAVNVGELYYRTMREFGNQRADQVLAEFYTYPVQVVPVDWPLAYGAAALKGVFPISYADCIAAALAQRLGATLITGDQDFAVIPDLNVDWLPAS